MTNKQEILQKLTGIQSSRKSYYSELNYLVEEMKKKNKHLEVINQLTKIQLHASWPEVSIYIAIQLSQIISFDSFSLTVVKGSVLSSYLATEDASGWHCDMLEKSLGGLANATVTDMEKVLSDAFSDCHFSTVSLRSSLNQTFGFLTLLHREIPKSYEDGLALFRWIGEHVGVSVENVLLFQDVCEKVNMEAQLVQSAKMAAIGEMAAGIAHELNSPLTAILGNAQLIMREIESEPYYPLMRDIFHCGVRCKKIIQNLLTFSRQEEYRFETMTFDKVIQDVWGLIGYQLTVSGISVRMQLSPAPLSFHGSRHQIEQILINLLLNARDALGEQEHPEIMIETTERELAEGRFVELSVRDNGLGIRPEHLQQIFQPFFTTKESTKGTGLGLSISLGIAQAHGGKLLVESEVDQYSKFTLLLPSLQPTEGE